MDQIEHIDWAGRTLSGEDRFGTWNTQLPDGWWDSPPSKGNVVDRQNAHGEYDLPIYSAARGVTFNGSLRTPSHQEMHEARDYFMGPSRGRVQVAGHGPTRWADAKLDGQARFTPQTDTYATWQLPLKLPDPFLYGTRRTYDLSAGNAAKVFHRGNTDALPVVQINGPLAGGFTITHPHGQYKALGDLSAGGWIRVDFATGRLRLNGNDRSDLIIRADLFQVPPGLPPEGYGYTFSLSNGSGYVEVLDTYK